MSRYIDADDLIAKWYRTSVRGRTEFDQVIMNMPTIDLADYVPKEFHDKTCEAMAKRHADEIASMPDIVRCKECRWWVVAMDENNSDEDYLKCSMDKWPNADDYCSYGERKDKEITTDCSWK